MLERVTLTAQQSWNLGWSWLYAVTTGETQHLSHFRRLEIWRNDSMDFSCAVSIWNGPAECLCEWLDPTGLGCSL